MHHRLSVPDLSLSPSANSSVTGISTVEGVDTTAAALLKTHRRDQIKEGHRSNQNRGGAGRGKPGRCSLSLSLVNRGRWGGWLWWQLSRAINRRKRPSLHPKSRRCCGNCWGEHAVVMGSLCFSYFDTLLKKQKFLVKKNQNRARSAQLTHTRSYSSFSHAHDDIIRSATFTHTKISNSWSLVD